MTRSNDDPLFWDGPVDPDLAAASTSCRNTVFGHSASAGRNRVWQDRPQHATYEEAYEWAIQQCPDGKVTMDMDILPDGTRRMRTWLNWRIPLWEESCSAEEWRRALQATRTKRVASVDEGQA